MVQNTFGCGEREIGDFPAQFNAGLRNLEAEVLFGLFKRRLGFAAGFVLNFFGDAPAFVDGLLDLCAGFIVDFLNVRGVFCLERFEVFL